MIDLKKFRIENNITQAELCELFGVKQPYISAIESGKRPLGSDRYNQLYEKYGDIIKNYTIEAKETVMTKGNGVPYYDIDVTATITESFNDVKETPEFYVDFRPFNDCTAYLPIFGDSMYPTFASGEIIAVKKLNNKDIILWGEAHLIITNELANNMKTVKLLFPHDDPDKIILRASNPNFKGDTIILKESIINLYIVKGKITRKQL